MESFRAVYQREMIVSSERFAVHVIGRRMAIRHASNVPQGVACHFFHIFLDEIRTQTISGIEVLPPGSAILFSPHTPILIEPIEPGAAWRQSWIRLSGTVVQAIFAENGIRSHVPYIEPGAEFHERFLMQMRDELDHPKGALNQNVEDIFRIWMRSLRRETAGATPSIPPAIAKARRLIETRFIDLPNLAGIAAACGISVSYLCKAFQKHYSVSPIAYAIELRLQHAQDLLKNVDLSVSEIADESGFSDVFYFSRLYKRRFGVPPSQHRS